MAEDYKYWLRDKLSHACVENLQNHRFDAKLVANVQEAKNLVLQMTEPHKTIGFGGSFTTRALDIVETLQKQGKEVLDHGAAGLTFEETLEIRRRQLTCDCFMCSANAISLTGEIVNVDGVGNRTSSMTFGPKKVIVVAGVNKICNDLDSALKRVKEVAAPMRAKSLETKTPCTLTGVCEDCNSNTRICNATLILHRRPSLTDMSVIIVQQSLGF